MNGKYSFQYVKSGSIIPSEPHTKGTQPLCYCEGLVLVDCPMENADLSFRYSEAHATIESAMTSVKTQEVARLSPPSIGAVIAQELKTLRPTKSSRGNKELSRREESFPLSTEETRSNIIPETKSLASRSALRYGLE